MTPSRWRLWWRFGFGPILGVLRILPLAEWRRESWGWQIDVWAMDHIGRPIRWRPWAEALVGALALVLLFVFAFMLLPILMAVPK